MKREEPRALTAWAWPMVGACVRDMGSGCATLRGWGEGASDLTQLNQAAKQGDSACTMAGAAPGCSAKREAAKKGDVCQGKGATDLSLVWSLWGWWHCCGRLDLGNMQRRRRWGSARWMLVPWLECVRQAWMKGCCVWSSVGENQQEEAAVSWGGED